MADKKALPGKDGNRYVPYNKRSGEKSVVYFTRDLSPEGLKKIYDRVKEGLDGKIGVKLHTGEAEGPNILPRPWVKELFADKLENATIIETNTYYEGDRYTTDVHRTTLETNGWTFAPVDIMDEDGVAALPVEGGKWFDEMHVGKNLLNYGSMGVNIVVLGMHAAAVNATFNPMALFYKEGQIKTGLYFSWEDYKEAFNLIKDNQEMFKTTITSVIGDSAEEIQNAFVKLFASGTNNECKILIEHDDTDED